mmetsp:Transcript_81869/g.226913  ORF Transcript_81869/g.226913 Transcript_81869/m.226913 type:complete len:272 (+) Transcript_81869:497-1312(+)
MPVCRLICTLPLPSISFSFCKLFLNAEVRASSNAPCAVSSSDWRRDTWLCKLASASRSASSALTCRFLATFTASSSLATCCCNCSEAARLWANSECVAISHLPMRFSIDAKDTFKPPSPWNMSFSCAFTDSKFDTVLFRTTSFNALISSCNWFIRDSSWVQRELSPVHRSCCFSEAARASSCQAAATFEAACSAITSTLLVISALADASSLTHWFRAKKESLNSARLPRDAQSCRNCSTDLFSRVSSFTCICTCAVAFKSTLRQSSKRVAK